MKGLSEKIRFFEKAFDVLNESYFESALLKPIITIQSSPKSYGHFTCGKIWKDTASSYHEINISAETINRPIQETLATLQHEMIHLYCAQNEIKDASRGGTYHNKIFKTEAEKRGLEIGYNKKIGHGPTKPTEAFLMLLQENKLINSITYYRESAKAETKTKKKSSTRKYICTICGISVRATKEVKIICADCETLMKEEN